MGGCSRRRTDLFHFRIANSRQDDGARKLRRVGTALPLQYADIAVVLAGAVGLDAVTADSGATLLWFA